MKAFVLAPLAAMAVAVGIPPGGAPRPEPVLQEARQESLDARVRGFLEANQRRWRDMNVPPADGQRLHDIVLEHGFTRALEIGTSTGHSGVWIAWALSRKGGSLVTVEIDEDRYREALRNFEEAGLADYIDARLADAHELVPRLEGPFDFVFIDADKDWYTRYFQAVYPKLEPGGCIAAHNVGGRRRGWVAEYLDAVEGTPGLVTTLDRGSRSGLAVSCRASGPGA